MHRPGKQKIFRFVSTITFLVADCFNLPVSSSEIVQIPSIVFDHPSQDYIFPSHNGSGRIIFAIRASRPSTQNLVFGDRNYVLEWATWTVILEVNAQVVGSWPALDLANTFGEVKVHIEFGSLPAGEHVATCRLVASTPAYHDVDIEHTISFHVGNIRLDEVNSDEDSGEFLCQLLRVLKREAHVLHCDHAGRYLESCDESAMSSQQRARHLHRPVPPLAFACRAMESNAARHAGREDWCGPRGTCVRGSCLCDADWAGPRWATHPPRGHAAGEMRRAGCYPDALVLVDRVAACLERRVPHPWLLFGPHPVWPSPCLALALFGPRPVWPSPCLALALFGPHPVWPSPCLALTLFGPRPVWPSPCSASRCLAPHSLIAAAAARVGCA
jgi:hypothetical protein